MEIIAEFGVVISNIINHPGWASGNALAIIITGTSYGQNNSQDFYRSDGNLTLLKNVNATQLEHGRITKNNLYDAIIFNNPLSEYGNDSANAALLRNFIQSARTRLAPDGEIHINITQRFLIRYKNSAAVLGVTDNSEKAVKRLPRFGNTEYFAPYIPQYSDYEEFPFDSPYDVQYLKNFVFR